MLHINRQKVVSNVCLSHKCCVPHPKTYLRLASRKSSSNWSSGKMWRVWHNRIYQVVLQSVEYGNREHTIKINIHMLNKQLRMPIYAIFEYLWLLSRWGGATRYFKYQLLFNKPKVFRKIVKVARGAFLFRSHRQTFKVLLEYLTGNNNINKTAFRDILIIITITV